MRRESTRTRVRFGETDAFGIVYYPTYFMWFDMGTVGLIRVPGTEMRNPDGKPHFPVPIVDCGATFVAPLRFDDEIEIVSQVVNVGTSSLRIEHEIRTLDGTTVARGFEARVHVAARAGGFAPAPIPDILRAHLSA